ncbi:hypothetical protein Tco_0280813 [Tanacetum coccineum]
MELHDVSYGIEYVARPLLLFFSSENRLLWFRYREYDLAHLKLIFEFFIYNVWKSVQYGVSNGLDTACWGFLEGDLETQKTGSEVDAEKTGSVVDGKVNVDTDDGGIGSLQALIPLVGPALDRSSRLLRL